MLRIIRRFISLVPLASLALLFGSDTVSARSFAYVTNYSSDTVSVIDTTSNSVVATIPVGSQPAAVTITPGGAFAYVTNRTSNTVAVIDTATQALTATVPVGSSPVGVAFTSDGARAYVANSGADTVSVIDAAANAVVATVSVGSFPFAVATVTFNDAPTDKGQCKDGGWRQFTSPAFKNQGQCVSFVESHPR
ncbi:MAG: YncE family protein [Pyrinomonadaceae bacterium]